MSSELISFLVIQTGMLLAVVTFIMVRGKDGGK
jgi:hypothetical protein